MLVFYRGKTKRRRPDSNRGCRICNPEDDVAKPLLNNVALHPCSDGCTNGCTSKPDLKQIAAELIACLSANDCEQLAQLLSSDISSEPERLKVPIVDKPDLL